MKQVSPAGLALINSAAFFSVDFYTITPASGPAVRLATADFDCFDNSGNVYSCGSYGSGFPKVDLKQSHIQGHWKEGTDSDVIQVFILPAVQDAFSGAYTYPDLFGSVPWLAACRAGMFDGATFLIQRAYFAAPPLPPYSIASRTPVATIVMFYGLAGQVDANQTESIFTVNDFKSLLTTAMPRNIFQLECRNMLFDSRCTLIKATFAKPATALAGSSRYLVIANPGLPAGSKNYNKGTFTFTSGANAGFSRTIANWSVNTNFVPQQPLPFNVGIGDAITFYPGCDKTTGNGGCGAGGFNNQVNNRSEPAIPVPEMQLG